MTQDELYQRLEQTAGRLYQACQDCAHPAILAADVAILQVISQKLVHLRSCERCHQAFSRARSSSRFCTRECQNRQNMDKVRQRRKAAKDQPAVFPTTALDGAKEPDYESSIC